MIHIEILESRIAPAVIVNPAAHNIATYKDVDGDLVMIKVSSGDLTAAGTFTTFPTGAGDQLRKIDFHNGGFANADLTITVKKVAGGDGLAHIGYINSTGHDLGKVTIPGDLGAIDAGDSDVTKPGLLALTARSMGRFGIETQGAGDLESDIVDLLGSLTVSGDVKSAFISVTGGSNGNVGPVKIGGSLLGGPMTGDGSIAADGDITSVQIKKDLIGGDGVGSGAVTSQGTLGPVTIGGSLAAGPNGNGGVISGKFSIGDVKIGGDVRGGALGNSGFITTSTGFIGKVTIGGSLIGGGGDDSGQISASTGIDVVKIGRSVLGGGGKRSGYIRSGGDLPGVTVGGSVLGGVGESSGQISSANTMGAVKIGGDLIGVGKDSGKIFSSVTSIASVTIGGSFQGGAGESSGQVFANESLGPVKIGRDMIGGHGLYSAEIFTNIAGIASVTVGGSMLAGEAQPGAVTGIPQPGIEAQTTLGPVKIKGSILGSDDSEIVITAGGNLTVPAGATTNVAITSIDVGGSVEHARILAGFDGFLAAINGSAGIGSVKVGGDWIASSLVAGVQNLGANNAAGGTGPDADNLIFGNNSDHHIAAGPAGIRAKIASVTIKGLVIGTGGIANDTFAFVAEEIGAFKAAGVAAPLMGGPNNDLFTLSAAHRIGTGKTTLSVPDMGEIHVVEVAP